jgi:hypothetical protein
MTAATKVSILGREDVTLHRVGSSDTRQIRRGDRIVALAQQCANGTWALVDCSGKDVTSRRFKSPAGVYEEVMISGYGLGAETHTVAASGKDAAIAVARAWRSGHTSHVRQLTKLDGAAYPPEGSDLHRPELWSSAHWRWLGSLDETVEVLSMVPGR